MSATEIIITPTWTSYATVDEYVHLQVQGAFFYTYNTGTPDPTDLGYLVEPNSPNGWSVVTGYALDTFWLKSLSSESQIGLLTIKAA